MMTDLDLLTDYANTRSEPAFAELVRRHGALVYACCYRVLGEVHASEDATQATFLILMRNAAKLSANTVLPTWLYVTALNCARQALRSATRRERLERAVGMKAEVTDEGLAWEEIRPVLDRAVAELPERQRDAIVLCYLRGYSMADAAVQLRVPKETIHTRLQVGMAKLRATFRRQNVTLSGMVLTGLIQQHAQAPAGDLVQRVQEGCLSGTASPAASQLATRAVRAETSGSLALRGVAAAILAVAGLGVLRLLSPAASAAAPPFQPVTPNAPPAVAVVENDGAHLDDAKRWRIYSDSAVAFAPAKFTVTLGAHKNQPQTEPARTSILELNGRALSPEPCVCRATVTLAAPKSVFFGITGLLLSSAEYKELVNSTKITKRTKELKLLYDGWGNVPATVVSGHITRMKNALTFGKVGTGLIDGGPNTEQLPMKPIGQYVPLQAGKHVFEMSVSKTAVWTKVDGVTLFHGEHGVKAAHDGAPVEDVLFYFGIVAAPDAPASEVVLEDVFVGNAIDLPQP